MTNAEKKALYTCNVKDFIHKFSDPKYKKNNRKQLDDVIDYLARYGMKGVKTEGTFDELLLTAKNLLLSQAAEQHLDEFNFNPYNHLGNLNMQEEYDLKNFILRPMHTIQDKMKYYDIDRKIKDETDPAKIQYYKDLKANAQKIHESIKDYNDEINNKHIDSYFEVINRIQNRLPETTKSLDEALDNNKGGVFERMFGTSSKQYANFKAAFEDFRNPNSVYLGDKDHLEKETKAYLHHIMPSYKMEDDLPTPEQFAKLSGTQKGRAAFCINVLRSVKEAREVEDIKGYVTKALKGDPEYTKAPIIIEHGQAEFQEELKDEIVNSSQVNMNKDDSSLDNTLSMDDSQLENNQLFEALTK